MVWIHATVTIFNELIDYCSKINQMLAFTSFVCSVSCDSYIPRIMLFYLEYNHSLHLLWNQGDRIYRELCDLRQCTGCFRGRLCFHMGSCTGSLYRLGLGDILGLSGKLKPLGCTLLCRCTRLCVPELGIPFQLRINVACRTDFCIFHCCKPGLRDIRYEFCIRLGGPDRSGHLADQLPGCTCIYTRACD